DLARVAELSKQPLRNNQVDRIRQQEGLDAHLVQTADGGWRVVRVQRRERKVTRVRQLYRQLGSFAVAHFPDHHDIRVVTEDCAQSALQRETGTELDLTHTRDDVLDRVFDG